MIPIYNPEFDVNKVPDNTQNHSLIQGKPFLEFPDVEISNSYSPNNLYKGTGENDTGRKVNIFSTHNQVRTTNDPLDQISEKDQKLERSMLEENFDDALE